MATLQEAAAALTDDGDSPWAPRLKSAVAVLIISRYGCFFASLRLAAAVPVVRADDRCVSL